MTNPAIDSIREEVVMSLECYIGPEGNLLETEENNCKRLLVPHPILVNAELTAIKNMRISGWRTKTIDITFPRVKGEASMLTSALGPKGQKNTDRHCARIRRSSGSTPPLSSDRLWS